MSDAQLYATQDDPPGELPWRWRVVVAAAWLGALALLAFTLAHWAWQWLGPAPLALPPSAAGGDYAARMAAAHLFGSAPAVLASSSTSAAASGSAELRLLGVFAQRDGNGYALFRAGARGPLLVAAGQDVVAGVHLDAVRPDGVTLTDGGVRRDMVLRPVASAERPRPAAAPAAKSTACAVPAGFAGPVLRVNAELLEGMMQAPDAWKALVEPASGALVVRDQSGFAGMLGLKNGDRVERANGIALAIPADIPSIVLQPLTRSQPVWLAGTRDGKSQQWLYLNAGTCPG
ncbi:MAG TPA: type II secretion system protein N [Casimicrobiaceae bacterium]|nr:type II secretion system protein N [Casimicrobiaceae bacterium]